MIVKILSRSNPYEGMMTGSALDLSPPVLAMAPARPVSLGVCADLFSFRKNEYSTLAAFMYGESDDRNRNRSRGNSIDGIQRNQIRAAQ